jgi:hypothetical protein
MTALFRIALVMAMLVIPRAGLAQDPSENPAQDTHQQTDRPAKTPHLGAGLICDSPEQVQRILALHGEGSSVQSALATVNLESHNPAACAIAVTAFVENEEVSKVNVPNGIVRLVQIIVFATMGATGWQRVPGAVQYTALFVKTESA